MPFITQGKTNWKFLLIVIVLTAIVGGGILAYLRTIEVIEEPLIEEPPVIEPVILPEEVKTEALLKILSAHRSDWTSPTDTQKSGTEWLGTITSINIEEKIIGVHGINQKIRSFVLAETIIEDKRGNPLSLDALKEGGFVSISGVYQMAGKMTPEWEVIIVADKIKVLGECVKEGEEKISDIWCCPGLTLIEQKYCTKCGDGICKPPENQKNCPLDCTSVDEPVSVIMFIDAESFDLNNKTFEGRTSVEGKNVKILTANSTKFYRVAEPGWQKEYFTFTEFHSLLENWVGPPWPFTVVGILEEEGVIKADEIYFIAQ